MMAGRRRLSTGLSVSTRTGNNGRKKLAVAAAAGSLVAFSASLTASAFLVEPTTGRTPSTHTPVWSRFLRSQTSDALLPAAQPWRLGSSSLWNSSIRTRSKTFRPAKRYNEDIDIDKDSLPSTTISSLEDKMETATAVAETLRNRFRVGDSYVWLYRDVDGNPTSWEKYTITDIEEGHSQSDELPQFFVATIEMSTKFEEEDDYQTHHRIKANLIDHVLESSESHSGWTIGFEYFVSDNNSWKAFGKGDNVQAFEEKFDVFSMVEAASASKKFAATAAAVNHRERSKGSKGGSGDYTEDPRDECLVPWTVALTKTTHCETSSSSSSLEDDKNKSTRSALLSVTNSLSSNRNQATKARESKSSTSSSSTKLTQTRRHGYTEAWYGPSNHDTLSGIALYKEFPNSKHSFSLIERTRTATATATATALANSFGTTTDVIEVIV